MVTASVLLALSESDAEDLLLDDSASVLLALSESDAEDLLLDDSDVDECVASFVSIWMISVGDSCLSFMSRLQTESLPRVSFLLSSKKDHVYPFY